jgi:hypothetical protein
VRKYKGRRNRYFTIAVGNETALKPEILNMTFEEARVNSSSQVSQISQVRSMNTVQQLKRTK